MVRKKIMQTADDSIEKALNKVFSIEDDKSVVESQKPSVAKSVVGHAVSGAVMGVSGRAVGSVKSSSNKLKENVLSSRKLPTPVKGSSDGPSMEFE